MNIGNAKANIIMALSSKGLSIDSNTPLNEIAGIIKSSNLYVPPKTLSGTTTINCGLGLGVHTGTVTFSKPFQKVPKVNITAIPTVMSSNYIASYKVTKITETEFTYTVTAADAPAQQFVGQRFDVRVSWTATAT